MSDILSDLGPSMKLIGLIIVNAVDSLPLPVLVVIFLALLASLRLPTAPDSPVLPSYSPTLADKSRLSPALLPHFPTIDEKARPQFVAVSPEREPPRIGRRGSKQREWRSGSLGNLGVLEEKDEERCVEV